MVGDAAFGQPKLADEFQPLFEDALVVLEGHMERKIFAPVVAAPGGKVDAAAGEQIERRPLLGDADRVVQRQHGHRRRQADALGAGGDIGEHEVGAGQHAERIEMVFADPRRVHAELFGIERLGGDVGDKLVRGTGIVVVMIVAEREITEIHFPLPTRTPCEQPSPPDLQRKRQ